MKTQGFTLIELSIVLVIIGLIVGGVLVGKDLIAAAQTRAQIAQIDRYNAAVETFKGKYGYLPGDMPDPYATQYGFQPRGTQPAQGDGNGVLEGFVSMSENPAGQCVGETAVFWRDLSDAKLIDGGFSIASETAYTNLNIGINDIYGYMPAAKLGPLGTVVYVWSGGWGDDGAGNDHYNYFSISTFVDQLGGFRFDSQSGLSVQQAFSIDQKIDDGLPQSGKVEAMFVNNNIIWWAAGGYEVIGALGGNDGPTTNATGYATTNCYDNNGVAGPQTYSMKNAPLLNCGLSFRFQ